MKLNFKNIGLILGLGAVMTFQSCVDLEPKLYSELDQEQFESSPEAFEGKLGDVYVNLQREYGYVYREGFWALQENTTDEVMIPTRWAGDWYDGENLWKLHYHNFTSKTREIAQNGQNGNNAWKFLYGGISKCNDMLRWMAEIYEKSDKSDLTTSEYKKNVAEVRILRAWYHYLAMDTFGNVPWVSSLDPTKTAPQLQREQVFDSIMVELNTYVPLARKVPIYSRVDQNVGNMVLAKMYLNANAWKVIGKATTLKKADGQPMTKEDCYAKAAEYSNKVITSGKYQLESNYFDNFKVDNEGSKENIWCVYYDANFSKGMQFHMMTLHYANKSTYGLSTTPWNGYCGHHKLLSLYQRKADAPATGYLENKDYQDVRINCWERGQQNAPSVSVAVDTMTFLLMPKQVHVPTNFPKTPQEFHDNAEVVTVVVNGKETTVRAVNCDFSPFFTDTVTTMENKAKVTDKDGNVKDVQNKIYNIFEGPRFRKFEIQRGVGDHMSNDFPIFRLADAYLMLAEAIVRAGGPVSYQDGDKTVQLTIADAQKYFDEVRTRAKVTTPFTLSYGDDNGSAVLGELCNERCRELLWEGHRRQDLIRFDRFTGVRSTESSSDPYNLWILRKTQTGQPIISQEFQKICPLPDFAVQNGYEQNPGYTK